MDAKPLVSVIIPVYNAEKTIDRCVQSVIDQTYKNVEIILVDDGSSDGSPEKCDEWCGKSPGERTVRVYHQPNSGVSCARNKGIDSALGEYVCFIDSDDWIENESIERLVEAALKYRSEYVIPRTQILIFDSGNLVETRHDPDALDFAYSSSELGSRFKEIRKYGILYSASGRLYNKEFLDKNAIRFDEEIRLLEDFAFNLKCLRHINCLVHINYMSYNFYVENLKGYAKKRDCRNYIMGIENVYMQMQTLCKYIDIPRLTEFNNFLLGYWGMTVDAALQKHSGKERYKMLRQIVNSLQSEKLLEDYSIGILPTEKRLLYKTGSPMLYRIIMMIKKIVSRQ